MQTSSELGDARRRPYALATLQMISGGSAGCVEVCLTQPLDVAQKRVQLLQERSGPGHHVCLADVFRKMYKAEGTSSFFKGIVPRLLTLTPKESIKFVSFEQFNRLFSVDEASPSPLGLTLSGLSSGILEGLIVNPYETFKTEWQIERKLCRQKESAFATAIRVKTAMTQGLGGIHCTMTSAVLRHGIFNMVYFGFYHNVKNIHSTQSDARIEFLRRFAIGFAAGVLGSVLNNPFSVAKTRIECQVSVGGHVKYDGCLRTIVKLFTEEGIRTLYRGFLPKLMILGTGSAIMMNTYEFVYEQLQKLL